MDNKLKIKNWILKNTKNMQIIAENNISDELPLLKERVISSLQLSEFILFLEEIRGEALDIDDLRAGAFNDINSIMKNFFKQQT